MAMTSTPIVNPIGAAIVKESAVSSTPDNDVRAGATTVYQVDVDNTANSAATFIKMADAASITVGTTSPEYILKVPASVRKVFTFDLAGVLFATGLSFYGVTTAALAGNTSPASACIVRVLCT